MTAGSIFSFLCVGLGEEGVESIVIDQLLLEVMHAGPLLKEAEQV